MGSKRLGGWAAGRPSGLLMSGRARFANAGHFVPAGWEAGGLVVVGNSEMMVMLLLAGTEMVPSGATTIEPVSGHPVR